MPEWTPALVEERLRKAVAVRAALVERPVVNEYASGASPENSGIIGGIGVGDVLADGDDGVIADAVEALSWLRWLEPDDAGITLARLEGAEWKSICWRYGISRPTADRHFRYGLAVIAWRLNGNARLDRTPSLRSLLGLRRAA